MSGISNPLQAPNEAQGAACGPADGGQEQVLTLDEAVAYASLLHRRGDLDEAEAIYREVLARREDHPDCLHFLGIPMHQRGDDAAAETLIRASIERVANPAGQWNNLGNVFVESGRLDAALTCYESSLQAQPDGLDAWNNLATLYRSLGRIQDSVDAACRVVTLDPRHQGARRLLGYAYSRLGQTDQAIAVYREWLAQEPDSPVARHLLAACLGEMPERASDAFVQITFDAFADSFDQKLEKLHYQAPGLVAEALIKALGGAAGPFDILDAGCGTGLCGPLLRPLAKRLTGVDLSGAMLTKAKARQAYDVLHLAELCAYLHHFPASFDAVISADTLCYFGDLAPVAQAAAVALKGPGVLVFTVEALAAPPEEGVPYRLAQHGRYTHSPDYVAQVLAAAGFSAEGLEAVILRREGGVPVEGWLVTARRCASGGDQ